MRSSLKVPPSNKTRYTKQLNGYVSWRLQYLHVLEHVVENVSHDSSSPARPLSHKCLRSVVSPNLRYLVYRMYRSRNYDEPCVGELTSAKLNQCMHRKKRKALRDRFVLLLPFPPCGYQPQHVDTRHVRSMSILRDSGPERRSSRHPQ